jgi:hypothetical protein
MGFDQKGASVFCTAPAARGQRHVNEEGFEKPLALFTLALFKSFADAREYERDIAKTKEGSTIKLFDQDGKQAKDEGTSAPLCA